jgi:hypothetical protein
MPGHPFWETHKSRLTIHLHSTLIKYPADRVFRRSCNRILKEHSAGIFVYFMVQGSQSPLTASPLLSGVGRRHDAGEGLAGIFLQTQLAFDTFCNSTKPF